MTLILLVPGCRKKQPESTTPLHQAARTGDVKFLKSLIAKGANVNERNLNGWTPLNYAIREGRLDIIEFIKAAVGDVGDYKPLNKINEDQ